MRIVIAQMKHETNTYSPVPTPLSRFAVGGGVPPEADAAYAAFKGTGSAIAAFIDLAEAAGAEIVIPIAAAAWPSGPVEDAAFENGLLHINLVRRIPERMKPKRIAIGNVAQLDKAGTGKAA